jgi:hypothetical protein
MSSPMMCVDFWRLEQQTQPYLKQKLGFISAQLHRGISGSCVFVNYAVGESVEYSVRLPVILLLGRLARVIQKALRRENH